MTDTDVQRCFKCNTPDQTHLVECRWDSDDDPRAQITGNPFVLCQHCIDRLTGTSWYKRGSQRLPRKDEVVQAGPRVRTRTIGHVSALPPIDPASYD